MINCVYSPGMYLNNIYILLRSISNEHLCAYTFPFIHPLKRPAFHILHILNTAQTRAKARVGPKLIAFLHLSAESGQLSSDSLSPEFSSLTLLYVHTDHFINDCAYGSIGFIILDMSCE